MKKLFLLMFLLIFLTSCSNIEDVNPFFIQTVDDVQISANYFEGKTDYGIILLPDANMCKNEWQNIDSLLVEKGFHVLSIEFRDSCMSAMVDDNLAKLVLDVDASVKYLQSKSVKKIFLVGNGLGSLISVKHAIQNKGIDGLVLINSDVDYKEVNIHENLFEIEVPVLVFLDSKNSDYIYEIIPSKKNSLLYSDSKTAVEGIFNWVWSFE